MVKINDDNSISATRGDTWKIPLTITAENWLIGFTNDDIIRFTVYEKGDVSNIVLQKEFTYSGDDLGYNNEENNFEVGIVMEFASDETKIGDVINKPKDYCYEIEHLHLYDGEPTEVTTIIGYDDDGEKILTLLPEANYPEEE